MRFPCSGRRPAFVAALLLGASSPALAERDLIVDAAEPLEEAPGAEARDTWDVRLGGLAGVAPDYEGSDDYEPDAVPYVHISWRDRITLHGYSLRGSAILTEHWDAGVRVRLRAGRDEDENAALRGLGDIDRTVEAGVFARYRNGPWRLRLNALQDIGGEHEGMLVELRAGARIPFAAPWFILEAAATWASDDYMETYFGVGPLQSLRSGLPVRAAEAGFKDVEIGLASRLPLGTHWYVVGALSYKRLLGDAADSALADTRGDADQFTANVGFVYRF